MNGDDYEKLCRDVKQSTQKIANDMFAHRKSVIIDKLQAAGVPLSDADTNTAVKPVKGRPKKD
jgi:hypothetical protein